MKFAVSAWSYHATDLDWFQMADAAKEAGFDGFEVLDLPCEPEEELDFAAKFRKHCEKIGLEICSAAVKADFLAGCDGDFDAEVERVKRKVDVCEALGVKQMRHDASWGVPEFMEGKTFEELLPRMAEGCRQVTAYAETKGIRTMTENHGRFCQGWEKMLALIKAVDHKNYGTLIDVGNFVGGGGVPVECVEKLIPYAFHFHCKDLIIHPADSDPGEAFSTSATGLRYRGTIVGHGNVNVKECIRIAKKAGYDSWLVLEFEGLEEPLAAISAGLANMKRYWETT